MTPEQQAHLQQQEQDGAQQVTIKDRMMSSLIRQRNEQMDRLVQCEASLEETSQGMKSAEALIMQLQTQIEILTEDNARYVTGNETNNALLDAAKAASKDLQSKLDDALARVQVLEDANKPALAEVSSSLVEPIPLSTGAALS